MRRAYWIVFLMPAIGGRPGVAPALVWDARSEIQSLLDRTAATMGEKDPEGGTEFLLRGASIRNKEGEAVSLADWKDMIRGLDGQKRTKVRIVVHEVVPRGEDVEVRYTQTMNCVWTDPHPGNEHKLAFEWKLRATMRRTAQGWREQARRAGHQGHRRRQTAHAGEAADPRCRFPLFLKLS